VVRDDRMQVVYGLRRSEMMCFKAYIYEGKEV
jgi:hypothetical protein